MLKVLNYPLKVDLFARKVAERSERGRREVAERGWKKDIIFPSFFFWLRWSRLKHRCRFDLRGPEEAADLQAVTAPPPAPPPTSTPPFANKDLTI